VRQILEVEMKGVPGKVKLYDVKGVAGPHGACLIDKDQTLNQVADGIAVQVFRLDQKMMSGKGESGRITYASLTSARVMFETAISPWEDIRMVVERSPGSQVDPEIYGKVISVANTDGGVEGLVRFTSVSSEAYKMLRQSIRSGRSSERTA